MNGVGHSELPGSDGICICVANIIYVQINVHEHLNYYLKLLYIFLVMVINHDRFSSRISYIIMIINHFVNEYFI